MRLIQQLGFYAFWLAVGYFSYLLLLISLQYVPFNLEVGFVKLKGELADQPHYQIALFTHVYTSIFTILFGAVQFIRLKSNKFGSFHRNIGKLYVLFIMFLSGPSALVMGIYANGGLVGQSSFVILSVLWMFFTAKAWQTAKTKDWEVHRRFMILSYALTLSAITLRLFKYILANTLALPPMDLYKIVAWSSWLFNLLIALFLIRKAKQS